MKLKDAIKALLAYINEVTGLGDTRLGDAIKHLAEGYNKSKE